MARTECKLKALRRRIEADHARLKLFPNSLWFWPRGNGVKGFYGTSRIIVTGLNPSMGSKRKGKIDPGETDSLQGKDFGGKTDNFFYHCLADCGLSDAHLTDLIKIRATRDDVPRLFYNPEILRRYRDYFANELRIIRPAVVVIMGDKTLEVLRGWKFAVPHGQGYGLRIEGRVVPIVHTIHPSAVRYRKHSLGLRIRRLVASV